jgi:hypothetical protein
MVLNDSNVGISECALVHFLLDRAAHSPLPAADDDRRT